MRKWLIAATAGLLFSAPALADESYGRCNINDRTVQYVQSQLAKVVNLPDANGGLFKPNRMWSAIVDRKGVLCSVISSDPDAWPGSRSIAIAKASTANDFSNNKTALSTANLYSFAQPANTQSATTFPAGSLYGLNNSNPFNPAFQPQGTGIGQVPGGIITFGGGVALYQNGQVIGGLGVSGDTACADHAIAYRMRHYAGLDITPSSDNIVYLGPGELPHDVDHPHCYPTHDITP
ncbi:MAG: heme-binding protein [Acetobacteraceae bacterium]|nr:heme-binding protein [Acetobacteraceae bacterium]